MKDKNLLVPKPKDQFEIKHKMTQEKKEQIARNRMCILKN